MSDDQVPAKAGDPMQEFREKLTAKVREDIAGLLPATAVAELVKRAVEDVFFEPRKVKTGSDYHPRFEEHPSWFMEAVATEAAPILKAAVTEYVASHKAEIDKAIADYLTPQNLTVLAVGALSANIEAGLYSLSQQIQTAMINR